LYIFSVIFGSTWAEYPPGVSLKEGSGPCRQISDQGRKACQGQTQDHCISHVSDKEKKVLWHWHQCPMLLKFSCPSCMNISCKPKCLSSAGLSNLVYYCLWVKLQHSQVVNTFQVFHPKSLRVYSLALPANNILTCKGLPRTNTLAYYKHSSLLQTLINYRCKKFHNIGLWINFWGNLLTH